jgi:endonuclease III
MCSVISSYCASRGPHSAIRAPRCRRVDVLSDPMTRPTYWPKAKRALIAADPVMGGIIGRYPRIALASRGDPFATLARSIVGQQISVKAADAVWARLLGACPEMTPKSILRRRATTLRACGLSERKVEYVVDLARHFEREHIDIATLQAAGDEEVIELLCAIRGIGRWTAEMFSDLQPAAPGRAAAGRPGAAQGDQPALPGRRTDGCPAQAGGSAACD